MFLIVSCKSPQIDFVIYNNISENEKLVVNNSFEWFNNIIGCPLVSIIFINSKSHFSLNNSIKELEFTDDYSACYNRENKILACAGGKDEDIIIIRNLMPLHHSKTCERLYVNKSKTPTFYCDEETCQFIPADKTLVPTYICDDRLPIIWHELGHTFGLQHSENAEDIMYPFANNFVTVSSLERFKQQLNEKTNICKEFIKH